MEKFIWLGGSSRVICPCASLIRYHGPHTIRFPPSWRCRAPQLKALSFLYHTLVSQGTVRWRDSGVFCLALSFSTECSTSWETCHFISITVLVIVVIIITGITFMTSSTSPSPHLLLIFSSSHHHHCYHFHLHVVIFSLPS